jgi:hypothetical protein
VGFAFVILERSDSDHAKDVKRRRSVSGNSVFLERAPVAMACLMQGHVTLSVTGAKLAAATQRSQDMLIIMCVVELVGLKVKKPMTLEVDNEGAKDLTHDLSVGGGTRHVNAREWCFERPEGRRNHHGEMDFWRQTQFRFVHIEFVRSFV